MDFISKLHLPKEKPLMKSVISQKNIHDVEDFYRLAVSLDCLPEFAYIYRSGNGEDDWESKTLSAQQKFAVLRKVKALNAEYKIEAYLPKCTFRCPYTEDGENMSVFIKANGDIQPCQTLYDEKYSIGNIFNFSENETLAKVYELVKLAKKRLHTDYGCKKCMLDKVC